jgi:hypothetical protein
MSHQTTADDRAPAESADEYAVPAEADDPLVCQYCGAPFATESYMALHWGQAHADALTDEEQSAYEDAIADEEEELRLFRLKAIGLLVLLYFGTMIAYALFV